MARAASIRTAQLAPTTADFTKKSKMDTKDLNPSDPMLSLRALGVLRGRYQASAGPLTQDTGTQATGRIARRLSGLHSALAQQRQHRLDIGFGVPARGGDPANACRFETRKSAADPEHGAEGFFF